ncbi:MAG TPA: beta-ketoacyl-[acyl-carrier-protein] synthase family protein [Rhodocyclaceae bacterium]|nr:beta-ketoacyl-[acyl-carrier-protein] synthase family protein [Rhodocyclaceae bacterium]
MQPLQLSAFTVTSCLGHGLEPTLKALREKRSGLSGRRFETVTLDTWTGEVAGVDDVIIPAALSSFDCRNNRLAWLGLQGDDFLGRIRDAVARYGTERIGVFLGTSTSGMLQVEQAYRHRDPMTGALPADFNYHHTHNSFSVTNFVRQALALRGPAFVVSTACSSSAKVFGNAQRMIAAGLIDAAVVGGVDSLCLTTLYGFHSLQLLANQPCRPFDAARDGLSIGEAAAFVLLERVQQRTGNNDIYLLGVGESSDAHHMSSPHPQGLGARRAIEMALEQAALCPADVDYINLHGTATRNNDAAEALAIEALFGPDTPCSSTKGATGHTLGAAGGVEAIICALSIQHDLAPAGVNTQTLDPELHVNYLRTNRETKIDCALSNSFGFGGTNCSLLLGRMPAT